MRMTVRSPLARPFHRRAIARAAACLLAAGSTLDVVAADPPDLQLPEIRVEGSAGDRRYRPGSATTATKTDTPLKEIPASLTVVPAQLIKDASLLSMGDLLRYVPGVMMHQGEGNRDDVVLRGNRTNADFFINGIRDDAQVFRDVYNLERLEVLKGPAGVIFGRGGAGGVINRVTKRPVFGPVGEASLLLGSYDQVRATFDVGNRIGDTVAWRINGVGERADSYRDGVDLDRYAVNPTVMFTLGPRTSLLLDFEHLNDRRHQDRGIPSQNGAPFDTSRSRFFGNAAQSNARSLVDSFMAVLDHEFENGWQLRNAFRVAHYDRFYQNVYPGSAVSAAGTLTISAYNNANQRSNVFNQADLTRSFATGALKHTLLAGVELGYQDSANQRLDGVFGANTLLNLPNVPASDPFATVTRFVANPNGSNAKNDVTANVAAAYIQDQVAFGDEVKLLAGLRYDRFEVDFDDQRTVVAPTDLSRTDTGVSPRVGVIFTPNARSSYYIAYSYAFLPSGEQLGLATTTADLAPEKARNYEVGARWDILRNLTLSAAVFRLDRDDVRSADPANPGFFVKTGQQRTNGVEIGLQGEITPRWLAYGGYTYLDSRVRKPFNSGTAATAATLVPAGNHVGLTPQNSFSLWNRFTLPAGFGAGLGIIYQGDYYTSFNNTVRVPSFTRVDGALYYTFANGRTRLALNVENIGNVKYYPTVDGDNNITPGAPTNARLTLTQTF